MLSKGISCKSVIVDGEEIPGARWRSLDYRMALSEALFGADRLRELEGLPDPRHGDRLFAVPCGSCDEKKPDIDWKALRPFLSLSLSADELEDNFYAHPIDVSSRGNILAICTSKLCFRNAEEGRSSQLCRFKNSSSGAEEVGTCARWLEDGVKSVAFHRSFDSEVASSMVSHDVESGRKLSSVGFPFCVTAAEKAGSGPELLLGSADGRVVVYDPRQHPFEVCRQLHEEFQEEELNKVCSLKLQTGGAKRLVAAGCNDNVVRLFDVRAFGGRVRRSTIFRLEGHRAAVKALDWHPSRDHGLVTGGGMADRSVKIWDLSMDRAREERGRTIILTDPWQSFDVDGQVSWLRWMSDDSLLAAFRRWGDLPNVKNSCMSFFRRSADGRFEVKGNLSGGDFANSIIDASYSDAGKILVTAHPDVDRGGFIETDGGLNVWNCEKMMDFLETQQKKKINRKINSCKSPPQSRFSYYANFK